jgi:diguanylate cyclase (GGDEF)-like protein
MTEYSPTIALTLHDHVPIGVLVIDGDHRIHLWNRWLSSKTGIHAGHAEGRRLEELYPDLKKQRFDWAVNQVVNHKSPQIMSQALNRFLLPIPVPKRHSRGEDTSFMQQQVMITPYIQGNNVLAVVSIMDVSDHVIRSTVMQETAQKYQHDSSHDPLTQLYNRRFMRDWLAHELKRCVRYNYMLACMIIDLDYFKQINDSYGHDKGDEALHEFAGMLAEQFRESDTLVRYGGEEFIVFLPRCNLEQACQKACRLQKVLNNKSIAGLETGVVTCSIGVSIYLPDSPVNSKELIKEADKQLYYAKSSGRNRIMPLADC